jgi:tRNA modification GTPase
VTRTRHVTALRQAVDALSSATLEIDASGYSELAAEEIRRALRALDALVGRVDVEHILDEVFASFCIGK